MTRHSFGDGRTFPSYAPRVIWHRLAHLLHISPLLGCSCTKCFYSRWRLEWGPHHIDRNVQASRDREDVQRLRKRVAAIESRLRETA